MSTAVPPSPQPVALPAGGAQPQAAASVPQAPQALLALRPGDMVAVTLLSAASGGKVLVDSDLGKFLLRTPLPLPDGTQARLVLVGTNGDTAYLRLQGLDGKPFAQGLHDILNGTRPGATLPSLGEGTALPSAPGAADRISAPPPGLLGQPLRATVLGVPPPGLALPGSEQAAALPPGTALTVRLTGFTPPGAAPDAPLMPLPTPLTGGGGLPAPPPAGNGPPPLGQPAMPGGAPPTEALPPPTTAPMPGAAAARPFLAGLLAAAGAPAPAAPAAGAVPPPAAGGPMPLTGAMPAPSVPGQTATAPAMPLQNSPLPNAPVLSGLVAPNSAAGQPLLMTGAGLLALDSPIDLPAGARVGLEVLSQQLPPPSPATAATPPLTASPLAQGWGALSDALETLSRLDPQAGRTLAAALPAADARLLSNAVAFMHAARSIDTRIWPGETALRALDGSDERGRTAARRIAAEVEGAAGRARDTSGDWRTMAMPFVHGGVIERITIVTRRPPQVDDEDDARKGGADPGHRFVMTFDLSNLGPMQMDGLYKTRSRRLDMMLRSHHPLPDRVRRDIQGMFARSAQVLNLQGGVSFVVTDRFIHPHGDQDGAAVTA